jgi:hypothetical protein
MIALIPANDFPLRAGRSRIAVLLVLASAIAVSGCATELSSSGATSGEQGGGPTTSSAGGGGSGGEGAGGDDPGACDEDCAAVETPPCLVAVCNEGQLPGEVGSCVVVDAPTGAPCDDGQFCTVVDSCDAGVCTGEGQNDCGMSPAACTEVTCVEATDSCTLAPALNGTSCDSDDLCAVGGKCVSGVCIGVPKDCSFSQFIECNAVACNPATGMCDPTPDASKNGNTCGLTGDLCQIGKSCSAGQCLGGSPKDCSAYAADCVDGACNPINGSCIAVPIPPGGTCSDGIAPCFTGVCDANASCQPVPLPDGSSCTDYNSCTGGDICAGGTCAGTPTVDCDVYFEAGFEGGCPAGWSLGGDWECGTPVNVGPASAHSGTACIGTQIDGDYSNGQGFATAVADTPPVSLAAATQPVLSFWTWIETEGSIFDGYNLKVSTDGGASFTQLMAVTPAYDLDIDGQPAWGGEQAGMGWQKFTGNLAAYAGQQVILRFAFRTDSSVTYPGIYLDDVTIAEPGVIP